MADCAPQPPVSLLFDRGTLIVQGPHDRAAALPGVVLDQRVGRWRAPAHAWAALHERLTGGPPPLPRVALLDPPALRPYQDAALTAWTVAGRRGVVVLPTGAGKTTLALAAVAHAGTPALVLVPTRVLLHQWLGALRAAGVVAPGCLGDGRHQLGGVTVATFESAWRQMARLGHRFGLVVVDEAHHVGAGARAECLEMCIAPYRLGLTATPPAGPAAGLLAALVGPTVFVLELADLAGSWLAPFDHVGLQLDLDAEERRAYDGRMRAFRAVHGPFREQHPEASWGDWVRWAAGTPGGRAALQALREARDLLRFPEAKRRVLASLLARHRDRPHLVFTGDNAVACRIAREHLLMPVTCEIGRAELDEALARFRAGELRGLVSARVLNEGFDVPEAEVAVIVGGSHGRREQVQRIGRILRPSPGKRATVYELVMRGTLEARQAARRSAGHAP